MANNEITKDIIKRFYLALDEVVSCRMVSSVTCFCTIYNIDRRNLHSQRKDINVSRFKIWWLHPLVVQYNISAKWLITGMGEMFAESGSIYMSENNCF